MGEIPTFSEGELMLSLGTSASFLTQLFRHAYPVGSGFDFRSSIETATNSGVVHLNCLSGCLPTVYEEMKYESSCCPPIWRS
jgi:hypothetical protein